MQNMVLNSKLPSKLACVLHRQIEHHVQVLFQGRDRLKLARGTLRTTCNRYLAPLNPPLAAGHHRSAVTDVTPVLYTISQSQTREGTWGDNTRESTAVTVGRTMSFTVPGPARRADLSKPLKPEEYSELFANTSTAAAAVSENFATLGSGIIVVSTGTPLSAKHECERLLTVREGHGDTKGVITIATGGEDNREHRNVVLPDGVAYPDVKGFDNTSGHGGQKVLLPAERPVIAQQRANLGRFVRDPEAEWQLNSMVCHSTTLQEGHGLWVAVPVLVAPFLFNSSVSHILCCVCGVQFLSIRVFSVNHDETAPTCARLSSINYAPGKRPSGKRFMLQTDGAHKFTARTCGAGELCVVDPTTGFGSLSSFAGKALRVSKAADNELGQHLEVTTADKMLCDITQANNQLASGELQVIFR